MTMFKRISCIALGTVLTSLISVVEPAQAFGTSVGGNTTASSAQTVGEQANNAEPSARSMSQSTLSSATTGVADVAIIVGIILMMLEVRMVSVVAIQPFSPSTSR